MINTFIKKPHTLQSTANFRLDNENFDDDKTVAKPTATLVAQAKPETETKKKSANSNASSTKEKLLSRYLYYISFSIMPDLSPVNYFLCY